MTKRRAIASAEAPELSAARAGERGARIKQLAKTPGGRGGTFGPLSTRAEAVAALGLESPRALDRLIEKGAPGPAPGKRGGARYDVAAIRQWQAGRKVRTRPALDLAAERAALAHTQNQLATLKLREARGELVTASDAERALRAIVTATKAQLLSVPRRAVLAGVPRDCEPIIKQLLVEALRDLAEVRTLRGLDSIGGRRHEDVA